MQSVLSRIWTHVAVSISYDDNHYTTKISRDTILPLIEEIRGFLPFPKSVLAWLGFELAYNDVKGQYFSDDATRPLTILKW